jgi:hypothetical protein
VLGTVSWLLVVGAGLGSLWSYSVSPGEAARPPSEWPPGTRLRRIEALPTLVLFVHPHCPCSRATIGELARLMAQAPGRMTTYVLFSRPPGVSTEWTRTDLRRSAARIPSASVSTDDDGNEARRFGAFTSGQALLYDGRGRLIFSGGITAARGHFGDNAGRSAIVAFVVDGERATPQTPVFGCPLFDPSEHCPKGAGPCARS